MLEKALKAKTRKALLSSIIKETSKIGIHLERPKWSVFAVGVLKINIFVCFSKRALDPFGPEKGSVKIVQQSFQWHFWKPKTTLQDASKGLPWPKNRSRMPAETCFQIFPGPGLKIAPGCFQESIFEHFQAQAQKSLQELSRNIVLTISRPRPKNRPRTLPENYF